MTDAMDALAAEVARLRAEIEAMRTELTVQRINIIEPDGTLRATISSSSRSHGGQIEDLRLASRDGQRPAGLTFFNDEGTECGGLVFGGGEQDGARDHHVHLSFDRFRNDQAIYLQCSDFGETWSAALQVQDRPAESLAPVIRRAMEIEAMQDGPGRQAALDELRGAQAGAPLRVFLGRDQQGRATLALHDGEQRPRLRMSVALDGTATLEFLDHNGEVVSALP